MAQITDDRLVVLLAHVPNINTKLPDIVLKLPETVGLTLFGHGYGEYPRLFSWSPQVTWRYCKGLAYGHGLAGRCDLVVSGGIGCPLAPVQFGVTPKISFVILKAAV